jgi:hypothetical protein
VQYLLPRADLCEPQEGVSPFRIAAKMIERGKVELRVIESPSSVHYSERDKWGLKNSYLYGSEQMKERTR